LYLARATSATEAFVVEAGDLEAGDVEAGDVEAGDVETGVIVAGFPHPHLDFLHGTEMFKVKEPSGFRVHWSAFGGEAAESMLLGCRRSRFMSTLMGVSYQLLTAFSVTGDSTAVSRHPVGKRSRHY